MSAIRVPLYITACLLLASCQPNKTPSISEDPPASTSTQRILSLNGTLSEIVVALGEGEQIVGVDVTTTFPESLQDVPRLGHSKALSVEGALALSPTLVLALKKDLSTDIADQLQAGGAEVILFDQEYSSEGTQQLIRSVAEAVGREKEGEALAQQLRTDLEGVKLLSSEPKVLFVYARGAGSVMVGGSGTAAEVMIEAAGAQNAAKEIEGFKPLTEEAILLANPDVILMFDRGLESLEGTAGLLALPGMAATNAGQNQRVVTMEGQFLLGFGPRLPQALQVLVQKISSAMK